MKLKKVYLFASVFSQYGVLGHFTRELSNALNRQGIISRVIEAKRDNPGAFVEEILKDPPDCTLSFNGLLPDQEGHFLCDLIKIPHVACLTDAAHHFFPLVQSHRNIITCVDQDFCQIFRDFQFPSVLFFPHAASKCFHSSLRPDPIYEVVMPASFIDYEAVRESWSKKYSSELISVLEETAELVLNQQSLDYVKAFVNTLDQRLRIGIRIDPHQLNYTEVLDDLEVYIGGKSRIELLQAIQDVPVHLFGKEDGEGWKKYVWQQSNIHIHPAVPYHEVLELMKKSKIILNCTPEIKRGGHERIFSGLAARTAVLTLDTPYMREHFQDEENILLFKPRHWEEVNDKLKTYLQHDDKRHRLASRGYEKVMLEHTWDQRAEQLVEELPTFLEGIHQRSPSSPLVK
jgi:glycosyltransferase involved in cell wall biosynthesis